MFVSKLEEGRITSVAAWEFAIPNDETDKDNHDHILIMEMPGINESLKLAISKN